MKVSEFSNLKQCINPKCINFGFVRLVKGEDGMKMVSTLLSEGSLISFGAFLFLNCLKYH